MKQVIVITGASSGFGALAARRLADAGSVAEAIVTVVDAPFGKRPFRVHVDPSQDGAEIVHGVADRVTLSRIFWLRDAPSRMKVGPPDFVGGTGIRQGDWALHAAEHSRNRFRAAADLKFFEHRAEIVLDGLG
jgi:hypothetical protein